VGLEKELALEPDPYRYERRSKMDLEPKEEAQTVENMVEIIVGILMGMTDDPDFTDYV